MSHVVAPRNLQITPRQPIYYPGDRIQCAAEGNPTPSYQWTDLVSGTVIQGPVLNITEDMVNGSLAFQCTASNQYNRTSANLPFFVTGISVRVDVKHEYNFYISITFLDLTKSLST